MQNALYCIQRSDSKLFNKKRAAPKKGTTLTSQLDYTFRSAHCKDRRAYFMSFSILEAYISKCRREGAQPSFVGLNAYKKSLKK